MEEVVSVNIDFLFKNPIAPAWQQVAFNETNKLRNMQRELKLDLDDIVNELLTAIKENKKANIHPEKLDIYINKNKETALGSILSGIRDNLNKAKQIM